MDVTYDYSQNPPTLLVGGSKTSSGRTLGNITNNDLNNMIDNIPGASDSMFGNVNEGGLNLDYPDTLFGLFSAANPYGSGYEALLNTTHFIQAAQIVYQNLAVQAVAGQLTTRNRSLVPIMGELLRGVCGILATDRPTCRNFRNH